METTEITNLNDLADAARKTGECFKGMVWYRGQALAEWSLRPAAFREKPARYEQTVANHFKARAKSRHPNCPGDWSKDLPAWLALMQHYSLPTRLLDWSESIFTAAYFAVKSEYQDPTKTGDGAIWALDGAKLNGAFFGSQQMVCMHHPKVIALAEGAFDRSKAIPGIIAFEPDEVDPRMLVQQGRFTIHGDARAITELPNSEAFIRKFIIPMDAKRQIAENLGLVGMNPSTLFPDLQHLAWWVQRTWSTEKQ